MRLRDNLTGTHNLSAGIDHAARKSAEAGHSTSRTNQHGRHSALRAGHVRHGDHAPGADFRLGPGLLRNSAASEAVVHGRPTTVSPDSTASARSPRTRYWTVLAPNPRPAIARSLHRLNVHRHRHRQDRTATRAIPTRCHSALSPAHEHAARDNAVSTADCLTSTGRQEHQAGTRHSGSTDHQPKYPIRPSSVGLSRNHSRSPRIQDPILPLLPRCSEFADSPTGGSAPGAWSPWRTCPRGVALCRPC